MRTRTLALSALLMMAAAQVAAQPPDTPTPGPEQKRLARFAGTWKSEGTMQASPFGPGGAMTGTETCRMFEGGWHLVCEGSGTSPMGPMKSTMLMSYDRGAKTYRYFSVSNMPDAEIGTGTVSGGTWTWTSRMDFGGKTMHSRFTIVETSPTQHTYKWEMSEDGKAWNPVMEGKATKTGS